ncbi:MAG: glycan-binding surface protein [Chitinophagaceae bacterium]
MKSIKILLALLITVSAVSLFTACKKEESTATPVIYYVRVTTPESSDSLLVGASQGQLIAIMGDNLKNAVEVWFNDQKAVLTPTYITNTSILVRIPTQIPIEITNTLRIIFKNGYELVYTFEVQISKPEISSMDCEYVKQGEVATINGNYFYEPLTVTFTGGVTGTLVSVDDQKIEVRVPAGALPGPVTVTTNFGTTESDFWFRDNRNMLITNDPWSGWWGSDKVVSGTDPLAINGNFTRMTQSIGSWGWTEWIGGKEDALTTSHNLPDEAVLSPEKYVMKFEINTLKPYNGNRIKFMIGQVNGPDPSWDNEPYFWEPPFDTKGKWQTVSVPFDIVVDKYTTNWGVRPQGYGVKIWFHGPGALEADIAFDNLRVVPREL